jgi:formate C-acetyltransferase
MDVTRTITPEDYRIAGPHQENKKGSRGQRLLKRMLETPPYVCPERFRLVTESYHENEAASPSIRRAKAFEHILRNMKVYILEEELIVGHMGSYQRSAPLFPEFSCGWLVEELDRIENRTQDPYRLDRETKKLIRQYAPFWKGRTLNERIIKSLPDWIQVARNASVYDLRSQEEAGLGHVLLDIPRVLREGLEGIREECHSRLEAVKAHDPTNVSRTEFWQAVKISCNAAIEFVKRYADEARHLAQRENSPGRRAELMEIAKICEQVPAKPAQTFWEAVQSAWFIQMLVQIETNGVSISPGRVDQFLYPYYKKDSESGRLSWERAFEILECFIVKFDEVVRIRPEGPSHITAGYLTTQNMTLGGQTIEGDDATNELTYLFLDAYANLGVKNSLTVRIHKRTPWTLLRRACEVIGKGGGLPQLMSDEVCIPSLLSRGVSIKDARDWAVVGCVELSALGTWGRFNSSYTNIAKVLELTLFNGFDPLNGIQVGAATGITADFPQMEQIMEAFKKQMAHCVSIMVAENNIVERTHREMMPHIFMSCLVPGCVASGRDVTEGGAKYNWCGPIGVGLTNAGDSFAAIEKVVFQDRQYSMEQLLKALKDDFIGHDNLWAALCNAPKYGNDDEFADRWVTWVANIFFDEVEKHVTPRGGTYVPGLLAVSSNFTLGKGTGAMPDGRKASYPLADGISPTHGCDQKGPTAVLKSASKIDFTRVTDGSVLNLKFHPRTLEGEEGLDKFARMLFTYLIDLNGQQVQVNVISRETLLAAQHDPKTYRNLVIRVVGYSAFFVELAKEVQDDIIARTEWKQC